MWSVLTQRVQRFILWHRRGIAALAAAVCIFAVVSALTPASHGGRDVVVVVRAVAAGSTVTSDDLSVQKIPDEVIPDNALNSVDAAIGKVAVVPLTPATVVTSAYLLGANSAPTGTRQVPIRVPDADLVTLLRVGDRVSVVAPSSEGGSRVIASNTRVAALPQINAGTGLSTGERSALIVLEVPQDAAAAVSMASLQRSLNLVFG